MDMLNVKLSEKPGLKKLITCAFPNYKRREALVSVFPETGVNINSYWDGGSRDEFALINTKTGVVRNLPTSHPVYDLHGVNDSTPELKSVNGNVTLMRLPQDFVLIQAGTSMGKPAKAHIYVSQSQNLLENKEENAS